MSTATPVFIGGVAGTGKTRLGTLLGRHSSLSITRRTYLWRRCFGRFGDLTDPAARERCITAMFDIPGVVALGIDPGVVRTTVTDRGCTTYAEVFGVVHELAAARAGRSRWGDQLGLVEQYAEPIFAAWPDARVIHLVADPRHRAGPSRPVWSGWDLGKWTTSVEKARHNRRRFGSRYLVLRHEDLVVDEEGVLRAVCDHVGVRFEAAMLDDSTHDPRFRACADPAFVEKRCADLLADVGYPATIPAGTRSVGSLLTRPLNAAGFNAWRRWRAPHLDREAATSR